MKDVVKGERVTLSLKDCGRTHGPLIEVPRWCLPHPSCRQPCASPRGSLGWEACQVHQDHRDVPNQDRQLPGLGNALHPILLEAPSKLDKLRQLLMVVPGVQAPGLRLRQCHLMQVKIPLFPSSKTFFPHSILSRPRVCLAWVLCACILSSSLSFCPFGIKVSTNLDQGYLRNLGLLLPYNEDLVPLG
jgi:hypothetical protein